MLRNLILGIGLTTVLASCATIKESRVNPFNWGKKNTSEVTEADVKPLVPTRNTVQITDSRTAISSLTSLQVANVPGGVLVTAQGQPAVAGVYNAELVTVGRDSGVLVLELRVQRPSTAVGGRVGPIAVSRVLAAKDLAGVRAIQVNSQSNSLSRRN